MAQTQPDGYLALPATGTGSAVLVLHAWWGLNSVIRAFCDRLAEAGFVAFAPDLYHGKVTDQIADAEQLASALDTRVDQARADLAAAVSFLKARAGSDSAGMAVIGFSLGAFFALDLSASAPDDIRSVVLFYGSGPADFSRSKADYLAHFAEHDPYEPQSNVDALAEALRRARRPATFYQYDGVGHWFFEADRRQAYDPAAASLAWERTLAFLRRGAG
ncbi:MAG: dienelactone hydrolase family protein [Anaerolineae bacterium]|nr:dienelactone hydrolase family protein [Anaerolineae bacterium]